jgi:hypothetical protein
MDQNNFNHKLIIAALAGMVEDDGLTPHEAFAVLEDIKCNTFHALAEIHREVKK